MPGVLAVSYVIASRAGTLPNRHRTTYARLPRSPIPPPSRDRVLARTAVLQRAFPVTYANVRRANRRGGKCIVRKSVAIERRVRGQGTSGQGSGPGGDTAAGRRAFPDW